MQYTLKDYEKDYIKDIQHANHVMNLALKIFEEVNSKIKPMSEKKCKYLSTGAFLHDIGYKIGSKGHNKYSQKIILERGIESLDDRECMIVSCIARYHRGGKPDKKRHDVYCNLDKKERKTVKRLSGILRIADGLDRNHAGLIQDIKVEYDDENRICIFVLYPKNNEFRPDISDAIKKRDVFEGAFKVQAIFKFA